MSSVDQAIAELDRIGPVPPAGPVSSILNFPRPRILRSLSAFAGLLAAVVAGISKLTLNPHRGTDYGAIGLLVLLSPLLFLMVTARGPRRHSLFQTCNLALWLSFLGPMLVFFPEVADITIRGIPIYLAGSALLGAAVIEARHRTKRFQPRDGFTDTDRGSDSPKTPSLFRRALRRLLAFVHAASEPVTFARAAFREQRTLVSLRRPSF